MNCAICDARPAIETCPRIPNRLICHSCHASSRLAFACPCLSLDAANAVLDEEQKHNEEIEIMARRRKTDTPTPNKKSNGAPPTPATEERVERARYEDSLPCKLDPEMLPVRANELASVIRERDEVKERKRAINATFREKLAFYDERLKELAAQVEGKVEKRPVKCVEYLYARTGEIEIVRLDTGEVVERHAATPEERQLDLLGKKGGNDNDDDAPDSSETLFGEAAPSDAPSPAPAS